MLERFKLTFSTKNDFLLQGKFICLKLSTYMYRIQVSDIGWIYPSIQLRSGNPDEFYQYLQNELTTCVKGVQWLSGRVIDSKLRGYRFKPHRYHLVVSLSKTH